MLIGAAGKRAAADIGVGAHFREQPTYLPAEMSVLPLAIVGLGKESWKEFQGTHTDGVLVNCDKPSRSCLALPIERHVGLGRREIGTEARRRACLPYLTLH